MARQSAKPGTREVDLLIVGTGSIGERHTRCFLRTGRVRVWIAESHAPTRDRVAAGYPLQGAYATLDDALARRYDAAVVATPANLHTEMATRLVDAGLHVLIEKPLATSFAGLDRLQALVDERRVVAQVAYPWRSNPALRVVKQVIDDGRIGDPVELLLVAGQHFPATRPAYREVYFASHAAGGGAIQDAVTHLVNAGEWLVGPVDRLMADHAHQVMRGVDVEDTAHLLTRHRRSGHPQVLGAITLNLHQPPSETRMTVIGTEGLVRLDSGTVRVMQEVEGVDRPQVPWEVLDPPPFERDDMMTDQAASFLDAIQYGERPRCTLAEARQTLRVCLTALRGRQAWLTPEEAT